MSRVVMRQEWDALLFLHWEISPEQVQARLPEGLTVDTFRGKTYLGLVPFTMRNVRPVWSPPVSWLSHFHETNVRVYVRDKSGRAGVYFFSLEAANPIAVELARGLFKLPYHWAKMTMERTGSQIRYSSERLSHPPRPAHCQVTYGPQPGTVLGRAAPGTVEHFLIERYTLFSVSGKTLLSGRVAHPPYSFQPAAFSDLNQTLTHAAGFALDSPPLLAHYSPGVAVDIYPLTPV
ncbi:YqjF family protein [Armatimonas sp.]|uniref:YqjF family protein n=1 Tax=Armatimonas sp. TaxID=1872638 RepID=UPI0037522C0F